MKKLAICTICVEHHASFIIDERLWSNNQRKSFLSSIKWLSTCDRCYQFWPYYATSPPWYEHYVSKPPHNCMSHRIIYQCRHRHFCPGHFITSHYNLQGILKHQHSSQQRPRRSAHQPPSLSPLGFPSVIIGFPRSSLDDTFSHEPEVDWLIG